MQNGLRKRFEAYITAKRIKKRTCVIISILSVIIALSVYAALTLPAISMATKQPVLEAGPAVTVLGNELSVRVTAEAPMGEENSVFALHAQGNGSALSDAFVFDQDETCIVEDEAGHEIELHRETGEEGETDFWFSLAPEQKTSFLLDFDSDARIDLEEDPLESPEDTVEPGKDIENMDPVSLEENARPFEETAEKSEGILGSSAEAEKFDTPKQAIPLAEDVEADEETSGREEESAVRNTSSEEEADEELQDTGEEIQSEPERPEPDVLANEEENRYLTIWGGMGDDYQSARKAALARKEPLELVWKEQLEERSLTAVTDTGVTITMTGLENVFPSGNITLAADELLEGAKRETQSESSIPEDEILSSKEQNSPVSSEKEKQESEENTVDEGAISSLESIDDEEKAAPITRENARQRLKQAVKASGEEALETRLFDIRLLRNGVEVEPSGPVTVTFSGLTEEAPDTTQAKVFHVDESADAVTDMEAKLKNNGDVIMETDHFSVYGVILTAAAQSSITEQDILDGLGIANQFAVFANQMEAQGHMEGNIAAKELTLISGSEFDFGNTQSVGDQYGPSNTVALTITKAVSGTAPSDAVYTFGVYGADGKQVGQLLKIQGAGSVSVDLKPGNYRVYELQDGKKLEQGEGNGFTVSYDALNLSGFLGGGAAGYVNNASYVETFKKSTVTNMKTQNLAALYVGSENIINTKDPSITTKDGYKVTALNARTGLLRQPTNIDWEGTFQSLISLSENLAGCATNYDKAKINTGIPGVYFLNLVVPRNGSVQKSDLAKAIGETDPNLNSGIPLKDKQYLVVNLDCSNVPAGTAVTLPDAAPNSNNAAGWSKDYCRMIWNMVSDGDCYTGTTKMQNNAAGTILAPKGTVNQSATFAGSILANKAVRTSNEIHQHSFRFSGVAETTVTNTYEQEAEPTTSLVIQKEWAGDAESNRPSEITVEVLANGKPTGQIVELAASNGWTATVSNLAIKDSDGNEIVYSIAEKNTAGYTASVSATAVTDEAYWVRTDRFEDGGTYILAAAPGTGDIYADEANGGKNTHNWQTSTIHVTEGRLTVGGREYKQYITDEEAQRHLAMQWTADDIGIKDINHVGARHCFTLLNVDCGKYLSTVGGGPDLRTDPRNTACWIFYGLTILDENGDEMDTGHLPENNPEEEWEHIIGGGNFYYLLNKNGKPATGGDPDNKDAVCQPFYLYKRVEVPIQTVTVTNTYLGENDSTSVKVTKEWVGDEDNSSTRPKNITVHLLADGEETGDPITLSAGNNWSGEWKDLPLLRPDGAPIDYSVKEEEVDGYYPSIKKEVVEREGTWKEVSNFTDGKTYLLVNSNGKALASAGSDTSNLTAVDVTSHVGAGTKPSAAVMWKASSSGRGFKLANEANERRILGLFYQNNAYQVFASPSDATSNILHYRDGKLYLQFVYGGYTYTYYLYGMPNYSGASTTNYSDYATQFTLYEWEESFSTTLSFTLTNTKYNEVVDHITLPHKKQIDAFRDGKDNPDTTLDNSNKDPTDLYRLYLDVGPLQTGEPVDVLLVLDNSGSMIQNADVNNMTRLEALNEVLKGTQESEGFIENFLNANPENRISIVYFSGPYSYYKSGAPTPTHKTSPKWETNWADGAFAIDKSSGGSGKAFYGDAWRACDWTSSISAVESSLETTSVNGWYAGTNYQAGLLKAQQQLENRNSDHKAYMLFLSDGVPTHYLQKNGSRGGNGLESIDSNLTSSKNASLTAIKSFQGENPELSISTVGFSNSINNGTKPDVLKQMCRNGNFYAANDKDALLDAFEKLMSPPRVTVATISDKLSKYVEWYGEQPDVKVMMTPESQIPIVLWEGKGSSTGGSVGSATQNNIATQDEKQISIVQDVIYTPVQGNEDTTGTVTVVFNPAYVLNPDYNYSLSFNVKTTQTAYEEYAENLQNSTDGYEGVRGDGNPSTDYSGNNTSTNWPGFHSNYQADLSYIVNEQAYKESYKHPVIQVAGCGLTIRKADGEDENKRLAGAEFDLYRLAAKETAGAEPIPGTEDIYGVKVNETSLVTSSTGEITVTNLPPSEFYLVETRAPSGYQLLRKPIRFKLTSTEVDIIGDGSDQNMVLAFGPEENGYPGLTVKNTNGYQLPATGGGGTNIFTVLGLSLIAGTGVFLLVRRRRGRRCGSL